MKKSLILLIFISVSSQGLSQNFYSADQFENAGGTVWDPLLEINDQAVTGVVTDNYEDERPKLWKQVKDGRADGLWMEWYENGNLKYKAEWRAGKGHGHWQYFYENGQLRSDEIYEEDINQGVGLHYHQNGHLKKKTYHLKGKKIGEWVTYAPDGQPKSYQIFQVGKLIKEGDYEKK